MKPYMLLLGLGAVGGIAYFLAKKKENDKRTRLSVNVSRAAIGTRSPGWPQPRNVPIGVLY